MTRRPTLSNSRLALLLAAALPAISAAVLTAPATAAPLLAQAPLTQYDSTPDCPVSATHTVCGPWNVPADPSSVFGAGDYGQCAYWVGVKYPALVDDEAAGDPLGTNWDGGTWIEHAQEEGLPVTSSPAPGDIAVWASEPSDETGHVAYVEAVEPDGSVIVSQMDGDTAAGSSFPALQGTTEYLSPSDLAYFRSSYDLRYVDTGDTDTGTPSSYVQLPDATAAAGSSAAGLQSASSQATASAATPRSVATSAATASSALTPAPAATGATAASVKKASTPQVHYRLSGVVLSVSATIAGGSRPSVTAVSGRRTVRLASTRYGVSYTFTGRLRAGRWTVRIVAGGWKRTLHLRVA